MLSSIAESGESYPEPMDSVPEFDTMAFIAAALFCLNLRRLSRGPLRNVCLILIGILISALGCKADPIVFPDGYIPFGSIFYVSAPDADGYSIVEGLVDAEDTVDPLLRYVNSLSTPTKDQTFANEEVELAPGMFFSNVLVPTTDEREGNFESVDIPIIDVYSNAPFPQNIIPMDLLGTPFVFVLAPATSDSPVPEPSTLILTGLAILALVRTLKNKATSPATFGK